MGKCYEHEECEYNAQPNCALPERMRCPHEDGWRQAIGFAMNMMQCPLDGGKIMAERILCGDEICCAFTETQETFSPSEAERGG